MSTDPTGLGSETCIAAINRQYINIKFDRTEWCTCKDDCLISHTLVWPPEQLCFICKYRKPLDIPKILEEHKKEKVNEGN